jgi:hypothetical protein
VDISFGVDGSGGGVTVEKLGGRDSVIVPLGKTDEIPLELSESIAWFPSDIIPSVGCFDAVGREVVVEPAGVCVDGIP